MVEELASSLSSLPSLIPNTSSLSSDYHTGDEVSASLFLYISPILILVLIFSTLEICPLEDLPLNIPFQWSPPSSLPPIGYPLPLASPQTPSFLTDSPPYILMSPKYHLASLTPLLVSPPLEAILSSPSITSLWDLSQEDISHPPLHRLSSNQVKKKATSKKKNMWQRL